MALPALRDHDVNANLLFQLYWLLLTIIDYYSYAPAISNIYMALGDYSLL